MRVLALAVMALVSCGRSPQTHYYTLAAAAGGARTYGGPPVRLESVQVPPSLDSPQMVRRSSPYTLDIAGHERWSDDLGYLMRQAVAQDLATRLPDGALIYPDAPKPAGSFGWVVDVLSLVEIDGALTLDASWTLLASNPPGVVGRHQKTWKESVNGTAESTSEGLSRILARLADDMADSLAADAAGAASGS